jgi:transcriptional regulator with XRE-family HTH domain
MNTLQQKLKPILKQHGIKMEDFAERLKMSRNNLYIVGRQSIVDGSLLDKIAEELEIDKSFLDEFRHPSVHQSQQANGNDGASVSQSMGSHAAMEEMKALYERLLAEKDAQINFLKELLKQQ